MQTLADHSSMLLQGYCSQNTPSPMQVTFMDTHINGHGKDYADINTSVARILLINSIITVGTTIVKYCGENIFTLFELSDAWY